MFSMSKREKKKWKKEPSYENWKHQNTSPKMSSGVAVFEFEFWPFSYAWTGTLTTWHYKDDFIASRDLQIQISVNNMISNSPVRVEKTNHALPPIVDTLWIHKEKRGHHHYWFERLWLGLPKAQRQSESRSMYIARGRFADLPNHRYQMSPITIFQFFQGPRS
jgi:hypothetical protein